MNFHLSILKTCGLLCLTTAVLAAQTPAPSFEVASIKATQGESRDNPPHLAIDKGRVDVGRLSLQDLLTVAWHMKPYQIKGPDFLTSEHFDIIAKMPPGAAADQVPLMLQALLAERFGLKVHQESREQPIYGLVVAKGGLKIRERADSLEAPQDPPAPNAMSGWTPMGTIRVSPGPKGGSDVAGAGLRMSAGPNGMHLSAERFSMIIDLMGMMGGGGIDRPIVDKTNLPGKYEIELDIQPPMRQAMQPGDLPPGPPVNPLFAAVEKLGLKLEPQKDQVETLIVDHIEKAPTEN